MSRSGKWNKIIILHSYYHPFYDRTQQYIRCNIMQSGNIPKCHILCPMNLFSDLLEMVFPRLFSSCPFFPQERPGHESLRRHMKPIYRIDVHFQVDGSTLFSVYFPPL